MRIGADGGVTVDRESARHIDDANQIPIRDISSIELGGSMPGAERPDGEAP